MWPAALEAPTPVLHRSVAELSLWGPRQHVHFRRLKIPQHKGKGLGAGKGL